MKLHDARPTPRLRCRKCGSTSVTLVGKLRRGLKAHHAADLQVQCYDCKHYWYSKSRAAQAMYHPFLAMTGQQITTWDEQPLKKPLTRPPLPD